MKRVLIVFTNEGVLANHQISAFNSILHNYKNIKYVMSHERFHEIAIEIFKNYPSRPKILQNPFFGRIDSSETLLKDLANEIMLAIQFLKACMKDDTGDGTYVVFTDCIIGRKICDELSNIMNPLVEPRRNGEPSDMAVFTT